MIKKFIAVAASVFLIAGCSLFGKKDDMPKLKAGETTSVQDFEQATKKMHTKWVDKLTEKLPEMNIPLKSKSNFSAEGSIDAPGVGNIKINVASESTSDMSQKSNFLSDGKLTATVKVATGATETTTPSGDLDLELLLKRIGDKAFISLAKFKLSSNDPTVSMVSETLTPFAEKWYGGSLKELETTLKNQGIPADLSGLSAEISPEVLQFKTRIKKALDELTLWKFKKGLPTADGKLVFEVELDKDGLKKGLVAFAKIGLTKPDGTVIESEVARATQDIDQFIAMITKVEGTLAIDQKNPEFFTFDGTITTATMPQGGKIAINWSEDKKTVQMSNAGAPAAETLLLEITTKDDGTDAIVIANADKSKTMLTGTSSEDKLEFSFNPDDSDADPELTADLDKDDGAYSGTINLPKEQIEITLNKLAYDKNSFALDFEVKQNGQAIAAGKVDFGFEEVKSVEVSEPATFETFDALIMQIQSALMPPVPADFDIPEGEVMTTDDFINEEIPENL